MCHTRRPRGPHRPAPTLHNRRIHPRPDDFSHAAEFGGAFGILNPALLAVLAHFILLAHDTNHSVSLSSSVSPVFGSGVLNGLYFDGARENPAAFWVRQPQTARRSRSTHNAGRIPRAPHSRPGIDVAAQSETQRAHPRAGHLALLFHRHSLGTERTPSRSASATHGPAVSDFSGFRRVAHA